MNIDDEEAAELKKRPLGPDGKPMSRKQMRQLCRMPLAMLKNLTKRPEVVEVRCEPFLFSCKTRIKIPPISNTFFFSRTSWD